MDLYKQYAISAMLAKFAYSNADTFGDLWFKMRDSKRDIISNVFKGVQEVPIYYNDQTTGVYGFSILKDRTLYFSFRGTNETQDSIVKLDRKMVPFFEGLKQSHIKVHQGFMKQFEALKGAVVKTVEKYLDRIDRIQFVGHSLGGALATLFAGYIGRFHRGYMDRYHRDIDIVCHTFGAPRVGNRHYAKWFQDSVKINARITNPNDPVAQMPCSAYFQHVSDTKCIMDDLKIKDIPDGPWYTRLVNLSCCAPSVSHTCDQYIERLMKLYVETKGTEKKALTIRID
jgi:predicted lipase